MGGNGLSSPEMFSPKLLKTVNLGRVSKRCDMSHFSFPKDTQEDTCFLGTVRCIPAILELC